jgi:hypothetical protein
MLASMGLPEAAMPLLPRLYPVFHVVPGLRE